MEHIDIHVLNQILDTKETLDNLYENQVELKAKIIKKHFYENGLKPTKLLAWRMHNNRLRDSYTK